MKYINDDIEKQRDGKNKSTKVNFKLINEGKYKKKFDKIVRDKNLSRLLYKCAKIMLKHRSGTLFEDMYWIDIDSKDIIAKEINSKKEQEITYSKRTEKNIKKYSKLIAMHSHPNSFPPSIYDLNSIYKHKYVLGIVICHNSKVYVYRSEQMINKPYYNLVVESYIKLNCNEEEAQLKTLEELKKNFSINVKEVV